jgi:hypothetical protein
MKTIQLTQGKVALVDDEDFEALSAVKWCAQRNVHTFYACRGVRKPGGGQKREYMHRLVLARKLDRDIAPGMEVDHDDGDGLNNQRCNMFEKTHRGNQENLHVAKSSRFVGVSWHKRSAKWVVNIRVAGKKIYLGGFDAELAAAQARESYIEAHPELGARSNQLDGET